MRKALLFWQAAGVLFTWSAGTLFHFLYDWSGKNWLAAAVSAVNESTWEHMKLLFFPMLLFSLVEYLVIGEKFRNFWSAKAAGSLLGLWLIPALFYTWNGALGPSPAWVNIVIFFLVAALAWGLDTRLLRRQPPGRSGLRQGIAAACLLTVALAFVVWTWAPPQFPLFRDPLTGGYGCCG